jgi:hypothetical protein
VRPESGEEFRDVLNSIVNADYKATEIEEFKRRFGLKNRSETDGKAIFPCDSGTKWNDIKITLISDDVVEIKTPLGTGKFSYRQLHMADNRTRERKSNMLWELLKLFAKSHRRIEPTNEKYDPTLPDTAKRLSKHLQGLFDIHETIFTGHYKAKGCYETKIIFSDKTQVIQ